MLSEGRQQPARALIASADARLRSALMQVLSQQGGVKAVGFIRSHDQVLSRTTVSAPELLLLDAQLRTEDQAGWLAALRQSLPGLRVIVYGVDRISPALRREVYGPDEARPASSLTLVAGGEHDGYRDLQAALRGLFGPRSANTAPAGPAAPAAPAPTSTLQTPPRESNCGVAGNPRFKPEALVIASSTGGPFALTTLVGMLPSNFALPIAVVQHMPPGFTTMLAERLDRACGLEVLEGKAGMEFVPGRIIIGPGDYHMTLHGKPGSCHVQLDQGEREHSCRPAANVLFRSAAHLFGGRVLTLVLTGMGRDGFEGARQLHQLGSRIIVQDAATSTVWGMPGAVAQAGLAHAVLPLQDIASELMRSL